MKNYHITKSKNGESWGLKQEGAQRSSVVAPTKKEIIKAASEFMKNKEGSVKIHKEDGRIQEERTYPRASDPHKTKG